jgi:hypothetical protein
MSVAVRLLWIVLIAIGAAFSAGMYLAGLESLSRMIKSEARPSLRRPGDGATRVKLRVAGRMNHA